MTPIPAVTFFNGQQMPVVGLGTFLATDSQELENALEVALEAGYRHFDTAFLYRNEDVIGRVLQRWLGDGRLKREDLFIVTKLPIHGMHPSRVGHFMKKSLAALQLDYVDLYLVHLPCGVKYVEDDVAKLIPGLDGKFDLDLTTNLEEIWKAMEEQVDAGHTKSIGTSNFSVSQLDRIMKVARIQPANNQLEVSIYVQQKNIRDACKKHGITVVAFAPLGRPGDPKNNMLDDPVIVEVAKKYNRTPAQIAMKFLLQQDLVVIPKSVTPSRIKQNIQLFDFTISDEDQQKLLQLERGISARIGLTLTSGRGLHEHPEWPFPKGQ